MLFVEGFRAVLVLIGALAGIEVGREIDASPAPVIGMVVGALLAYVLGGLLGRLLDRERVGALRRFEKVPPGELFAGTLTGTAGLLLGAALCLPFLAIWHSELVYPITTLVAWVFAWFGFRIGAVKGRQVAAAAGLTRILAPPTEPPPGFALLVDASAVMDRSLLVLGQAGLLMGGLVVPQFVVDQVRTLAAGPDPVSSRRARRGLEAIEALRERGVSVHVAAEELPEYDDQSQRLLEMARRLDLRLATCSGPLKDAARSRNLPVTDLRHLAEDLAPDHAAGEQLVVDILKTGSQPRQGVGYLPDGDMVVVNDAAHLVGRHGVHVEVLSTTRTHQGLLVFAQLDPTVPPDEGWGHEAVDGAEAEPEHEPAPSDKVGSRRRG
ncbi:MAG TPA: hypothetical protein VK277_16100 [Acidimicrobiales bacterium]|nr:hypothetical protein [Acidimicrobiales bacterium]